MRGAPPHRVLGVVSRRGGTGPPPLPTPHHPAPACRNGATWYFRVFVRKLVAEQEARKAAQDGAAAGDKKAA